MRERLTTTRYLQTELTRADNLQVSLETIKVHPRRPVTGPLLTVAHRRARLEFARTHAGCNLHEWDRVLFSDESRFCLHSLDRRVRVFRRPNERYAQCNILQKAPFRGGSVTVWAGVSSEASTGLHVFHRPNLNSERYISDILEEYVVLFAPFIGEDFIFQQDNGRPHSARVVSEIYSRGRS